MARHRKIHHGRRGGLRIGKYVSLAGKILGATVIASPAITAAINYLPSGNFNGFADKTVFGYTGFAINGGGWNAQQAFQGIGTVVSGYAIMRIFSWAGKHMR